MKQLVDGMIRGMEDALIDNNRIEIRGFGVFSIKAIRKTVMVNPRYNTIENKQHVTQSVHFKMGKELKLKVNKSALM